MTTQSLPKRARIFSPLVLLQISKLVDRGLTAAEIAEEVGCTIGTLRVKCSQHGISLRRCFNDPATNLRNKAYAQIVIQLSRSIAVRLQQVARVQGITGSRLAAVLLEAVVQDNLYDAVIDREIVKGEKGEMDRANR